MIALVNQLTIVPFQSHELIVEVHDTRVSQFWRNRWSYGASSDPRLPLGRAMEEMGRSLKLHHGHILIPAIPAVPDVKVGDFLPMLEFPSMDDLANWKGCTLKVVKK